MSCGSGRLIALITQQVIEYRAMFARYPDLSEIDRTKP